MIVTVSSARSTMPEKVTVSNNFKFLLASIQRTGMYSRYGWIFFVNPEVLKILYEIGSVHILRLLVLIGTFPLSSDISDCFQLMSHNLQRSRHGTRTSRR